MKPFSGTGARYWRDIKRLCYRFTRQRRGVALNRHHSRMASKKRAAPRAVWILARADRGNGLWAGDNQSGRLLLLRLHLHLIKRL